MAGRRKLADVQREKSAEQKSLQAFKTADPDKDRRFFVSWVPGESTSTKRRNYPVSTATLDHPTLAIRYGENPDHHLWNNNGTWWCHYTEHLPDYTKRRVRRSLHTNEVGIARVLRDSLLCKAEHYEEEVCHV